MTKTSMKYDICKVVMKRVFLGIRYLYNIYTRDGITSTSLVHVQALHRTKSNAVLSLFRLQLGQTKWPHCMLAPTTPTISGFTFRMLCNAMNPLRTVCSSKALRHNQNHFRFCRHDDRLATIYKCTLNYFVPQMWYDKLSHYKSSWTKILRLGYSLV